MKSIFYGLKTEVKMLSEVREKAMLFFSIALRFVQYSGVCAIRFGDCAARVKRAGTTGLR